VPFELPGAFAGDPVLLHLGILLGTFVLEDAATATAALLASSDMIPVWSALLTLYLGIFAGDLGLYGLGYAAGHNAPLRNFIGQHRIQAGRQWLSRRLIVALVTARFVPGLRLPTYSASGYFRVSLTQFASIAAIAAGLWTTMLFALIYTFGEIVLPMLGAWRWIAAVAIVSVVVVLPYLISLLFPSARESSQ
jgi:membrane protein DedA with SNARE-associated domain